MDVEKLWGAFVEAVTEAMSKGDDVTLIGFGTFSIAKTSARIGRNFKTGKNVTIPASKHVKFKAGKTLKEAANSQPASDRSFSFYIFSRK